MPRKKKTDVETDGTAEPAEPATTTATETASAPSPRSPGEDAEAPVSNGEKKQPVFKVGPIATDANNAVAAAVWGNQHTAKDGREFTVYNVTVESRWRDALIYCLQRCSDWILAQRDPANSPF
jgi:hypothetical protein